MCDLLMPEVSGHEVVSVVNRMEQKPKIGVMTGWSEDVDLTKDGKVKLNVDFIIKKPFKFPDLARHVNALFA
jgi:FixJ family two-component response regulator